MFNAAFLKGSKMIVRDKLPLIMKLYHKMLHIIRRVSYFLPISIRLQKRINLTINERKNIVRKLYEQKEEQPLFSGKRVLLWEPAPWPIHVAISSAIGAALYIKEGAMLNMLFVIVLLLLV